MINNNSLIISHTKFVKLFSKDSFEFESGERLNDLEIAYQTYGRLNDTGDNAILICHALTGNAHAAGIINEKEIINSKNHYFLSKYNEMFAGKTGWWDRLIGSGKLFDTDKYFVVCPNILGSCYGTYGPASKDAGSNKTFGLDFPAVTVRDMVKLQKALLDYLNVSRLITAAGGSLGGMQVLEWAAMFPDFLRSIIPIATSAAHSAWAMSLNKAAKDAIISDPLWNGGRYIEQPVAGLSLARKIAMISYRAFPSFNKKFGRELQTDNSNGNRFQIESYLDYQGDKLVKRFDANTYLYLANAMDMHDIGKDRGSIEEVLGNITLPSLCIGIETDILYPAEEQKYIAGNLKNSIYREISSPHGHDAFLIEFDQLEKLIKPFILEL